MARRCIFCGGSPLTNEDVIPKWVSALVARPVAPGSRNYTVSTGPAREGRRSATAQQWQSDLLGTKAKQVCGTCNNGWMSNLEVAAKPLLVPMLKGEKAELPPEGQLVVARWAFKTALMAQYIRTPVVPVPIERLRWLRTQSEPPTKAWMGLAHYVGKTYASWLFHKGVLWLGEGAIPLTARGHLVTLCLGRMVIQTVV